MVSYSHSIVTMAVSCITSENRNFLYPMHSTPSFPNSRRNCHTVWCGKTRVVWIPEGEKVWW